MTTITKTEYSNAFEGYLLTGVSTSPAEHGNRWIWMFSDSLAAEQPDPVTYEDESKAMTGAVIWIKQNRPDLVLTAKNETNEWMRYNNHRIEK